MAFTIAYDIKAIDKFSDVAEKVRRSIDKMEGSVRKVQRTNEKATQSFKKVGTVAQQSSAKINRSIIKTNTKLKTQGRTLRDNVALLRKVGGGFETLGNRIMTRVVAPMTAAGGFSIKAAMDINKGMSTIATLMPGQTARVRELKNEIQALAMETGTSTADLTEGVYAAVSAWGDSADTMERMRVVTEASKAGLASTGETLALFTSLTEIFGDNSAQAVQHISDLAFQTNKLAIKAPFGEMAASMGSVAPLAKQIGVSVEDMFATMTAQAGVTGTVSEVSTQMAGLYTSIIKETPRMSKIVSAMNREMGTSFKTAEDAIGNMGTLPFLSEMTKHTRDTTDLAKALGGRKEGMVLALSLVNSRSKKYNEALRVMRNESGTTKVAFNEVANGINESGHSWDKSRQKMMVMAQRLGDKLLPVFDRLLGRIEPFIDKIANLDDETLNLILDIGVSAAKFGVLAIAIGKITSISGILIDFFGASSNGLATMGTQAAGTTAGLTKMSGVLQRLPATIGAVTLAFTAGYEAGRLLWNEIERAQERRVQDENKIARETIGARKMSFVDARAALERRTESWRKAAYNRAATGAGGVDLLKGELSKNRNLRMQQEHARALKRRMDNLISADKARAELIRTGGMSAQEQSSIANQWMEQMSMQRMSGQSIDSNSEQYFRIQLDISDPGNRVDSVKKKTSGGPGKLDVGTQNRLKK